MTKIPITSTSDGIEGQLQAGISYTAALGKLFCIFRDFSGKTVPEDNPEATLDSVGQTIWILDNIKSTPEGKPSFQGQVRYTEYFSMPNNKNFEKMKWKSKAFYDKFAGVVFGDRGDKKINWENAELHLGQKFKVMFGQNEYGMNIKYPSIMLLPDMKVDPTTIYEFQLIQEQKFKDKAASKKSRLDELPVEDMPF